MITKEAAFKKISDLVERFEEQFTSYKKADYNETLTRRDFIDPFFKALGWDIDNEEGYAQSYREVIHEDKVKVGRATKAPDYSFRLSGGKRLFFVEAKKPSVSIKDEIQPAYQVRRYGWSAKLAISVITDFEEFAIYDCTRKPISTDKAAVARIKYINYKDYVKEFDFIWNTFSKERVLKGSFDKFIEGNANKKGTTTVDREFLISLDSWRTYLATSISLRNKELNEDEINFAVQQTIDRIIFLRIAEDRGVEPYGNLQVAVKQGDYYQNLFSVFKDADDKYNSGLFNLKKDQISQNLKIDNKVLKTILNELYYPLSPYEFSVLSVEILGSAYEQFLGKVIRITPSHHAIIEDKPEVRKAGGVYYTPQYIVEYIVKNTVGKLVAGKKPTEISNLTIVDPACGSGSFLIGAYQYLLDYHKDYYSNNGKPSKGGTKNNPLTPEGYLTTAEKKRILLNNIYGVDIDINAVEVTKLSLLLKCMEGETSASISHQLSMFNERVLPTLENNIKDGNSLVDLDYYDEQIDFGDEKKIKPFSWQRAFPEVFKIEKPTTNQNFKAQFNKVKELYDDSNDLIEKYSVKDELTIYGRHGGFDVVIGNPPYLGGREWKTENGNVYDYFISKYKVAEYQFDIYALFWEAGIKLLNQKGLIGFITPNTWLNNQSNKKLRNYILENTSIKKIVDYSKIRVFDQATVLPIVTILENKISKNNITEVFEPIEKAFVITQSVHQAIWNDGDLNIININLSHNDLQLRDKIEENTQELEKLALIKFGIKIYETGKGKPVQKANFPKDRVYESDTKIDETYRPYLEGKDINPYSIIYKNRWLKYGENLAAQRNPILFEGERILVRRIVGKTLISAYTNSDYVTSQLLQIVKPIDQSISKFLLGIINSKLLAFYFRKKYNRQDKTFPEIRIYELASLPIKQIDNEKKPLQNEIVKFVDQLLKLNEEKATTKLQTSISQLESRIEYCENKIDEIVYQLYELTDEEIKIVEGK
ncbi:MAG: N-6 DNA methylase [Paludibacter sp.]|nr:N-6 DNA methylase [Paludibacter sp.]